MNIKRNLLDFLQEVKEFPQFEKKLSELTDDKLKGDLFEVFCQAYLIKIHPQNFKFVRPFEHPENLLLLDKLNLRLKKEDAEKVRKYAYELKRLTENKN